MKFFMVFVAIFSIALAAPQSVSTDERHAQIRSQTFDNIGVDGYKFGFDTTNGITRKEEGDVKNIGTDNEELVVRGFFEWFDPLGGKHLTNFVADKDGYRAESSDIPQ